MLLQTAFCWPCKATFVHYRACGATGSTNQSWCGVKLLTMSVLTHPVGCVHICHLLRGQHHCQCPNGRENPPPACPPPTLPPPMQPPSIHNTCDITGVVKTISKTNGEYHTVEIAIEH